MNNPQIIVKNAPFKRFCMSIGAIPTSYLDSLDYYETLLWLIKYLEETIIPTVNNNGEAVSELQTLYIQLKDFVENYFANLDVQEEINNKLDEMVESGELQEIIGEYLNANALWCFNTVEDMENATNLIDGSFARTLGYYTINDGGGGLYKIREITTEDLNNDNLIPITNNLVADLIDNKKDIINVLQWGAYSDGLNDNTEIFNKIILYANTYNKNIYIPKGNYLINNDLIDIKGGISIYGDISGEGFNELKSTLIDNRTSNNYLLNIKKLDGFKKGGTIKYLNFITNQININDCIHIEDSNNYLGDISYCCFTDYCICINIDNSHGFVLNNCGFIRCGDKEESSSKYAIIVNNTTDCSIDNCCIDHTRYQLYADLNCMLYISNTHFELSTLNIVKGNSPIYLQMGNYGYTSFTNCSFINLSYLYWISVTDLTPSSVPFMIYGSYVGINNCMFSCGRGSGGYKTDIDRRAKFANLYYGSISNCKIKAPSYLINAFNLTEASMSNNHFQVDIMEEDINNLARNNYIVSTINVNHTNNYLQYYINPNIENLPTIYPCLFNNFNGLISIETNRDNILFNKKLQYSKISNINTLHIQSHDNLVGLYEIKFYSIGETKLIYDGYIRFNADKTITLVSEIYKSFGSGNNIVIYSDDNSNDKYIQINEPQYKTNTIICEIDNLIGHTNLNVYYDLTIDEALTYDNYLTIN